MKITNIAMIITILLVLIYAGHRSAKPQAEFVWVGDTRVHVNSTIHCSDIIETDTHEKAGEYIQITHEGNSIYIECVGENWEETKLQWLTAFKERIQ